MSTVNLTISPRQDAGKQAAKRARRSGFTPAVLYGAGHDPQAVQIATRDLHDFLVHGSLTSMVDIAIEGGENCKALLRDPITNPVTGEVIHIDFLRVTARSKVQVEIPIELEGTPAGLAEGGILDQIMRSVHVECLAMNIPEKISVDVSELGVGQNISISDISVDGVKILVDPSSTIAAVAIPRIVEEETEEEEIEEEEGAEPEVIGHKGKEGEEEEPE